MNHARLLRPQSLLKGQIKFKLYHCIPTPPNQYPTKYEHLTPYCYQTVARTRFLRSRLLHQGQRSSQCQTMMCTPAFPN